MKKGKFAFVFLFVVLGAMIFSTIAYASSVKFDTTTPTYGLKAVASGTKVSGSVTYANIVTEDCQEAFGANVQANPGNGFTYVTAQYTIYANDSVNMNYALTPSANTPMRLIIQNTVGLFGGESIVGSIDYK